jgi:upstream activation factor subunit UAF30
MMYAFTWGKSSICRGGGTKVAMKKAAKKAPAKKGSAKKAPAKKPVAKKAAAKKAAPKKKASGAKRKPNAAFMKPMNPTAILAAVIGEKALPRTEVTKKIWDYIKKNKLQDSANRRMINADDKLKAVFGGKKQVSMFEMTKLVSRNLEEEGKGDKTNDPGPYVTDRKR